MNMKNQLKAQMGMMEYIMLTFFIMVIVVVLIFFLGGWQVTQIELQKSRARSDKALALLKEVSSSSLFVKSDGVFDDTKLTAWLGRSCSELEEIFGGMGLKVEIKEDLAKLRVRVLQDLNR